MKCLKYLIKYALYAMILAVLFIDIWQAASLLLFKNNMPFVFGYSHVTVLSGSMEPAFSAGDLLIIHRENDYLEGDIISFWEDGNLITHRLIEKVSGGDEVITKGDFNNISDRNPVNKNQIAGRVVLVVPRIGKFILFLRTPSGLLMTILAIFAALFLRDWIGRLKERKRQ